LTPTNPTPNPPTNLQPLFEAADEISDKGALRLFVNSYAKIIEKAWYSRREPCEEDASAVEKVLEVVLLSLEMRRIREGLERDEVDM
jgi:hypothetical protein